MISWDKLPEKMKNDSVKEYYDILSKRKISLFFKRAFDFTVALLFSIILLPAAAVISVVIMIDSNGGVIFKQERIGRYNKHFYIYKFRTMVSDAEKLGDQITVSGDKRVTRAGAVLRRFHLDEIPQLINILKGEMSFVGTRPEVPKYVDFYTDEMMATLLLPAGVTSLASIMYKDENELISAAKDTCSVYVNEILPEKMRYNLQALKKFSVFSDMGIMFKTFFSVFIKKR